MNAKIRFPDIPRLAAAAAHWAAALRARKKKEGEERMRWTAEGAEQLITGYRLGTLAFFFGKEPKT
jgi:hypothetical protein